MLTHMKFTVDEFFAELPSPASGKWRDGVWDVVPFNKGRVSLVFFAPSGADYQTFHDEDEFYFIVKGNGEIVIGDERFEFAVGDAFFVAAKVEHRFENFSNDFATWAVFF